MEQAELLRHRSQPRKEFPMGNGDGKARLRARNRPALARGLSASSAHEINNPLESLLNLLFLLEGEPVLSESGRHYLALAREEVRRIAQIAQDTLHPRHVRALPQLTNVAALLDAVLDFYRPQFESSGIKTKTLYSGDGNIPAYPEQLRQVFSNLLLNAAEAMPKGGELCTKVSAGHEWTGKQRQGVRVTIADNGSGIPAETLKHVFQRFFTTKAKGNGIGLSLVKDVVQKHKGLLRVRSRTQPGHSGTVFTMFLPA
jgi:signal transduction histidine kinase